MFIPHHLTKKCNKIILYINKTSAPTGLKSSRLGNILYSFLKIIFKLLILVLVLDIPFNEWKLVKAQIIETEWDQPVLLFAGSGSIHRPIVLSDEEENVHVFWRFQSEDLDNTEMIYYTKWNGQIWSSPVDIIASPGIRSLSAAIDSRGMIHLTWTDTRFLLYYSTAFNNVSTSVRQWTKPINLGQAGPYHSIFVDNRDNLHLVYPNIQTGSVIYQRSEDRGSTWSVPIAVSGNVGINTLPSDSFMAISDSGTIHVVWTEYQLPDGWPPTGVFYSHSENNGLTWSTALEVAGLGYDQINLNVGSKGVIHLVWNGMSSVGGRYHKWSNNDGKTWSETITIVPGGGTSGPPQMVIDDSGILHLLITYDGARYGTWTGGDWESLENISEEETKVTQWIEEAVIAGSNNKLHAVFWADRKRLWYTSKAIPGLLNEKKSEQTDIISVNPNQDVVSAPSPMQPTVASSIQVPDQEFVIYSPTHFILIGAISPVIIVLAVWLIKRIRR
jgi:hypothetical protein